MDRTTLDSTIVSNICTACGTTAATMRATLQDISDNCLMPEDLQGTGALAITNFSIDTSGNVTANSLRTNAINFTTQIILKDGSGSGGSPSFYSVCTIDSSGNCIFEWLCPTTWTAGFYMSTDLEPYAIQFTYSDTYDVATFTVHGVAYFDLDGGNISGRPSVVIGAPLNLPYAYLPSGSGTPPSGMIVGDVWVDTSGGTNQGVLKICDTPT